MFKGVFWRLRSVLRGAYGAGGTAIRPDAPPASRGNVIEPLEQRCLLSWGGIDAAQAALDAWLAARNLDASFQPITTTNTGSTPTKPKATKPVVEAPQTPYTRKAFNVPGIIQAEYFDRGGDGAAYHDKTAGNQSGAFRASDSADIFAISDVGGGYAVNRTAGGEWLEYTINVAALGFYQLGVRVASLGVGGRFHLNLDGVKVTPTLTVPNTGGAQKWSTMTVGDIVLPAGTHVMRFCMDAVGPKGTVGNFNWMQFTQMPPTAPTDLSAVAESSIDVRLSWVETSQSATGVKIERKTDTDDVWTQIGIADAGETTYTDTGLDPDTSYIYRVRATNNAGDSPYSQEASATTLFADAIVITEGGTYSGQWQSFDPDVPAVTIDTDEPVIIENSVIRSQSNLVFTLGSSANITIRNTRGYALNPDVEGQYPGRFLNAEGFVSIAVENCYMEGTSGIYAYAYYGDGSDAQTIKILNNSAKNIDGRFSDGNGGFLSEGDHVQFFQMNGIEDLPGVEIAWNQVVNEPGNSLVEDNISIYASSGTQASPILIHDNFIQGAYTVDAANDGDYSGGGIMLSDGGSSWVQAYGNQVISTTNYGIAISSGHDNEFYDNRIVSCGLLADGQSIAAQNVGAYIWDSDGEGNFYNNLGHNNLIGWVQSGDRNDWWPPDASEWVNNTHWSGTISRATEAGEWTYWQNKLNGADMVVGVQ